MNVLAIDVGGTHVKLLASGRTAGLREFASGPSMTPGRMAKTVRRLAADWPCEAISIGYPGVVMHGRIAAEPRNLGRGWVGFDFEKALGHPVRIANDAAMQALGSYDGGRMLFLGLGTGLGSAMIVDGDLAPLELGHLPYKKGRTYEDYVGKRGLERLGKKRWRRHVALVIDALRGALKPDYVVVGGGNAKKLGRLPEGVRLGANANAFKGGFRLWESAPRAGAGGKKRQRAPPR